jgi:nucleotidyltransferase/DNA polymerase involved in DNA repair
VREQAVNPKLKGKPVVTGKERGIAAAVSYEAKARGVKRGMTIREIQALCPDAIHLPSDYETYSLFSQRMFAIVRRYTPDVEEYSIDECFCDLTGLRRPLRMSYETIAARIKADLEHDLGLTFAVGLAPTKVVAKLASKWQKPAGLTVISGHDLHLYLDQVPIGDVWGIGKQTTAYLTRFGIATALDFARQEELWVRSKLTKPHHDIWHELRGTAVIPLELGEHHAYQSISKTKTFTPPTSDREFLLAQLSKNVENACIKARRHKLEARRVSFFLRRPISPALSCRSSTRIWRPSTAQSSGTASRAWCSPTCAAQETPSLTSSGRLCGPSGYAASMTASTGWTLSMVSIPCSWGRALPPCRGNNTQATGRNFPAGGACCCQARTSGNASAFHSSGMFGNGEVTSPHFGPVQSSLPPAPGLEPDSLSGAVR